MILWMVAKSVSHHLRNPGMVRFLCKYPMVSAMVSMWCRISSIHSSFVSQRNGMTKGGVAKLPRTER